MEVVVSLGLLALVLVILVGLFLASHSATMGSRGSYAASSLLSAELSRLKLRPFSQLESMVGVPQPVKKITQDGVEFSLSLSVERLSSNSSLADYRVLRLEARADWQERRLDPGGFRATHRILQSEVSGLGAY